MTVTPIDKVLADGNCGRVTDRGKEARVQTCGATNRNRIQGRSAQVSVPGNTKPFSSRQEGKCGAHARKVHVLIRGDLSDVPGIRACPKARAVHAKATRCWAEVSRRHSTRLHTPLQRGRPERDAQVRACLTSLRQVGLPSLSHKVVNRQRQPTGKLAWTELRIGEPFNTRLEPPSALKRMLGGVGAGGGNAPGYPIVRHHVSTARYFLINSSIASLCSIGTGNAPLPRNGSLVLAWSIKVESVSPSHW